jgi:hypothetical protein
MSDNNNRPFPLLLRKYSIGFEERYPQNMAVHQSILAENLRDLRKNLFKGTDLPATAQRQCLAACVGIASTTYGRLEDGSKESSFLFDTLVRISTLASMPIQQLFVKQGVAQFFGQEMIGDYHGKTLLKGVNERVKNFVLFDSDEGASILLPTGKLLTREDNTSLEVKINNRYKFYIDFLRSAETGKRFFMYSPPPNLIVKINMVRVIADLPSELTAHRNVGTFGVLTCFREHSFSFFTHDKPMVLKNYEVGSLPETND